MTTGTDPYAGWRQTIPVVRRQISAPLGVVVALAVLLPAVTLAAGASLWGALDLSWLLLAAAALAHVMFRRRRPSGCWRTLVSLTLALVVLYPIISPDDDLLLLILPDDAQTVVASVTKQKHLAAPLNLHAMVAALASLLVALPTASYPVFEPQLSRAVVTFSHATGNHSPPSC